MYKLTLAICLALPASPGLAGICDTVVPGWQGQSFGAVDQFAYMLSGPFLVVLFILIGLANLSPWYWLKAALGVALAALAGLYGYNGFWPLRDVMQAACAEGCQGSPILCVILLAGIGVLIILRAFAQRAAR